MFDAAYALKWDALQKECTGKNWSVKIDKEAYFILTDTTDKSGQRTYKTRSVEKALGFIEGVAMGTVKWCGVKHPTHCVVEPGDHSRAWVSFFYDENEAIEHAQEEGEYAYVHKIP